jgi:FMN phosphatase YigB (HAD superfamily)
VNVTARPEAENARAPEARTTDARLKRAMHLLAEPDVRVLSLDVFDTMLFRRAPEPVDVFPMVARRLAERGMLSPQISLRAFQQLRIAAEARARAKRDGSGRGVEVGLRDIYAELPAYVVMHASAEECTKVELEVEREVLMPDLDVVELVRYAHSLGKRAIAVSDTYLSSVELTVLLDPGFSGDAALDGVYASSDHGVGKTSGMFELVLRELELEPRQLVHVGDNELADVESPAKLGIPTVHFRRGSAYLDAVLERERAYADPERPPVHGDAGLTAMRGKLLHRTELEALDEELRPFWAYGAACLGPALAGFGEWVVERTRAAGAERAHCLMREGELLSQVVNSAADYMGADIRAEPIWLSRHVCARASLVEGSARELRTLLVRRRPPTVRQLCETVGLDVEQSAGLRDRADARLDDAAAVDGVIAELTSDPELRAAMVANGRVLRERIVESIRQRVPEGQDSMVLVDLGWGGTIQTLLQQLLVRQASIDGTPELHTIGLYLVTHGLAVQRALDGIELEGFLGSFGVPGPAVRSIMRSPEILEQVCMPDVGSQVDLTAELEPVLGDSVDARIPQAAHRAAVQAGIRAFQREWARYAALMPGRRASLTEPDLRDQLVGQVARALVAPTGQEAAVFSSWIHDDNFGSHDSDLLVGGPHTARAFRHMEPSEIVKTPMSEVYWPFGLAALEDEHLALAAEAVTMGWLPAEAFHSVVEAGDFEVYYDNGFGYGEGWKEALESKRNRFGLSYARTTVRAEEVRGVRIDPAKAPCILRIDWIALTCSMRGQAEPRRLMFDSPESLERFTARGATALRPKLFMVDGDDPQFEIDLRDSRVRVRDPAHRAAGGGPPRARGGAPLGGPQSRRQAVRASGGEPQRGAGGRAAAQGLPAAQAPARSLRWSAASTSPGDTRSGGRRPTVTPASCCSCAPVSGCRSSTTRSRTRRAT